MTYFSEQGGITAVTKFARFLASHLISTLLVILLSLCAFG